METLSHAKKHDPVIVNKTKRGHRNATRTHHSIQNAMLDIMVNMIQQEIKDEINIATYFPFMSMNARMFQERTSYQ